VVTSIEVAVAAIHQGRIIGLPTDTVYGIGADPMQYSAVEQLFAAKQRPEIKPVPILGATIEALSTVALIDPDIGLLAERYWPGALTLILRRAPGLPDWVGDGVRDTVGVRIPNHPLALEVLDAAGPLAVTSANRSAGEPTNDAAAAESALGASVGVYLPGSAGGGLASTVVDLSGERPRILRVGPVEWIGE
jgi:tRNA threonylcarbamoyl adenosine modification protein (Sua5/YciO/YrdC/YwlC family)